MSSTLRVRLASLEGHLAAMMARFGGVEHTLLEHGDGPDLAEWQEGGEVYQGIAALDRLKSLSRPSRTVSVEDDGWWYQKVQAGLLDGLEVARTTLSQAAYETACRGYFETLEAIDKRLEGSRFLADPDRFGVSDLALFAVLVRHDVAFYPFFKMSLARLDDFEHLGGYARDLFQLPGFSDLVRLREARAHYARLDEGLNPKLRVPTGGLPDLWSPHLRHRRFGSRPTGTAASEDAGTGLNAAWIRPKSAHRGWVEADASAPHPLESGRYHLYVSHNCPWSHRVTLGRSVLGLEAAVSLDVLYYRRDPDRGWQFRPDVDGCTPDSLFGARYLRDIYAREGSAEKSVPVLYDKVAGKVVNNESAEILRMFGTEFRPLAHRPLELYPQPHAVDIDLLNQWIYQRINNGAYRAGFSSGQAAHEAAADGFFDALEGLERWMADGRRFLVGDALTEADVRLFPTLYRFDDVYFTRFLLNRRKLDAYPRLRRWLIHMLEVEGVRAASRMDHCKKGYFGRTGNGLVPLTAEAIA